MLADNAVPFINVGVYRPDRPYPCVGTDNEAAAYRAAMHVVELGHRKIGVVSALQRNNDRASARVQGFRRALSENGIGLPAQWHVEVPYTLDDAREAARYLLNLNDRPTAVVCGNDVIAYGVLLEAERSGFSVPRDLSVVGFDDLDWSRHLRPSLPRSRSRPATPGSAPANIWSDISPANKPSCITRSIFPLSSGNRQRRRAPDAGSSRNETP